MADNDNDKPGDIPLPPNLKMAPKVCMIFSNRLKKVLKLVFNCQNTVNLALYVILQGKTHNFLH